MVELVDGLLIVGDGIATATGCGWGGGRTSDDKGGIFAGAGGVTGRSVLAMAGALGNSGGKTLAGTEDAPSTFSESAFATSLITDRVAGAGAWYLFCSGIFGSSGSLAGSSSGDFAAVSKIGSGGRLLAAGGAGASGTVSSHITPLPM